MKLNLIKAYSLIVGIMAVGIYSGCKPDSLSGDGNGLTPKNLAASFTVTPVTGKPNYYTLKANETGLTAVKWDLGDGGGASLGTNIQVVFLPDAGTYNIVETAIGAGGVSKTSAPQTVTVPLSDPKSGNLVLGGKFGPGDDAHWIHFVVGGGNNMVINTDKGVMTSNQTNYNAGAIAQAFTLTAGQKYSVDMIVSGSGMNGSWFEVWVDTKAPVNGQDYNTGQKIISLNTFTSVTCGGNPFNGKLSALSCSGTGDPFTVPTTGTYYLVIKNGGVDTGITGVSFTNVTLRGVVN